MEKEQENSKRKDKSSRSNKKLIPKKVVEPTPKLAEREKASREKDSRLQSMRRTRLSIVANDGIQERNEDWSRSSE